MFLKRFKKIIKWILLSLLFIIIAAFILFNSDWGQNIILKQVTKKLSKNLATKIEIKHISFSLFNKMNLEGVLVEDRKKDTLLYAGKVQVRITDWFFIKDKTELKFVSLEDATVHLNRRDSVWNYKFIKDYFLSGTSSGSKEKIAIDLKKLELKNIYFLIKDEWRGEDMLLRLKGLDMDADELNFTTKKININNLVFTKPFFRLNNYTGQRPKLIVTETIEVPVEEKIIDSLLKWNAAGWVVHIDKMKIDEGVFRNEKESTTPYYSYFDGRYFDFSSIK